MNPYNQLYLDAAYDATDGPQIYHVWGSYMTISAYMAKRVYMRRGFHKIYPNLYCILVGQSTAFRKSTALDFSRMLINAVAPEFILPVDFSYEGLFNSMAQSPATAGILYFDEFENLMSKISRDNMSQLKGFLTTVYGVPEIPLKKSLVRDRKKKNPEADLTGKRTDDIELKDPYLSIFTGTTLEWLTKRLTEDDFRSGFMARWIFIPAAWSDVREEMPHPPPLNLDRLRDIEELIKTMGHMSGELTFEDQADYEEWFRDFSDRWTPRDENRPTDSVLEPYFDRLKTVAIKMAMLNHITKCQPSNVIGKDSVEFGWKSAEWLAKEMTSLKKRMAFTDSHRTFMRIGELLKSGPKTRSQIYRAMQVPSYELDKVLRGLTEDRVIHSELQGESHSKRLIYSLNGGGAELSI